MTLTATQHLYGTPFGPYGAFSGTPFTRYGTPFGATTAMGPASNPSLDHTLIPFLGSPYYLRLVNSDKRARQYAAAGYHVSVARGSAGGCNDPAISVQGGSSGVSCALPLHRSDLEAKWAAAADAYKNAYNRLGTVDQLKYELVEANKLADAAYAAEGVNPPRDPELVADAIDQGIPIINVPSEGPVVKPRGISAKSALVVGFIALGVVGATLGYANRSQKWW